MLAIFLKQSPYRALLILFVLNFNYSLAQTNLVPNASFEQYVNCPNNSTPQSAYVSTPLFWSKPDLRGAMYWHKCTNNQPQDGVPYNFFGGASIIKSHILAMGIWVCFTLIKIVTITFK